MRRAGWPTALLLFVSLGCDNPTLVGGLRPLFDPSQKGEEWTIECCVLTGPDHRTLADRYVQALRKAPGIDPARLEVTHDEHTSTIYYGRYRPRYKEGSVRPIFSKEAAEQVERIRNLRLGARYPFYGAHLVPVPTPDVGPPEWDIRRAPGKYTIEIAVFYDTPGKTGRKQFAVEYTEYWRKRGYPAWYHHGPIKSRVFIGNFDDDDYHMTPMGPTLSPRIQALLDKEEAFRYHVVNGGVERYRVGGRDMYVPSFVVPIPRE